MWPTGSLLVQKGLDWVNWSSENQYQTSTLTSKELTLFEEGQVSSSVLLTNQIEQKFATRASYIFSCCDPGIQNYGLRTGHINLCLSTETVVRT